MTRFTFDADVDTIRAALIDDILDDMSPDLIEAIITVHEAEFMALARRYLARWGMKTRRRFGSRKFAGGWQKKRFRFW